MGQALCHSHCDWIRIYDRHDRDRRRRSGCRNAFALSGDDDDVNLALHQIRDEPIDKFVVSRSEAVMNSRRLISRHRQKTTLRSIGDSRFQLVTGCVIKCGRPERAQF